MTMHPIKRALLSVSDKTGIIDFAQKLQALGVEILSTGGTAKALKNAGVKVTEVSDHTGFPEIMDGRVKTLHPTIHCGILARRDDAAHMKAMADHSIAPIDMVVLNLYPFVETLNSGADFAECVENIDIGGPAMLRAAAKNHDFVAILTHPEQYDVALSDIAAHGGAVTPENRRLFAAQAFALTAAYDSAVSNWLCSKAGLDFPHHVTFAGKLQQKLRYGENPHQAAALYLTPDSPRAGAATAQQIQGKELSYNNLNDTNAAYELVAEFDAPTVAIIKHANPCGVASAPDIAAAYTKALACDPTSAFGGIIALNRPLTAAAASLIMEIFVEVIIAPSIEPNALPLLAKKPNIRVLAAGALPDPLAPRRMVTPVAGGLLVQDMDTQTLDLKDLKTVTQRAPTAQEMEDLIFAFRVAKHVKSNAIIYARGGATMGIGAGQMSRIDSSRIAAWKMTESFPPSADPLIRSSAHLALASDAFFPFADGLIAAAEAGVTAIIQPGGSIRDAEVIAAADERGIAMVFTGIRHFRH